MCCKLLKWRKGVFQVIATNVSQIKCISFVHLPFKCPFKLRRETSTAIHVYDEQTHSLKPDPLHKHLLPLATVPHCPYQSYEHTAMRNSHTSSPVPSISDDETAIKYTPIHFQTLVVDP